MMDLGWVTLQRYELGKTEPKINRAAEIAKMLGTSTSYLCGEVDDPDAVLLIGDLNPKERELIRAFKNSDFKLLNSIMNEEARKQMLKK